MMGSSAISASLMVPGPALVSRISSAHQVGHILHKSIDMGRDGPLDAFAYPSALFRPVMTANPISIFESLIFLEISSSGPFTPPTKEP
jgi:hypothetical protein